MECRNHAGTVAVDRCVGCAEPFCDHSLVEIKDQKYCASCKIVTVQQTPDVETGAIPCEEADSALKYAVIGIFCFGIILGPMAIAKAMKAKGQIAEDPSLTGAGKANAAIVLGSIVILLWLLGILRRVAAM
jgi:hypothetical protein